MKSRPIRVLPLVAIVLLAVAIGSVRRSQAQTVDQLYGTWRLLKNTRTIVATGETTDVFGKAPNGFINYGRDGRMMVIGVSEERSAPADPTNVTDQERVELYRTMFAYGGTFTFDGKTVIHHVDVSYNQTWSGTDLTRQSKFEGSRLILTTPPAISNIDGKMTFSVLTWEKVK
jgi:hypothetical protein